MSKYLSYSESRDYMRGKDIKSNKDWRLYKKTNEFPSFLPRNPDVFYKDDWVNWMDFLSFIRTSKTKRFKKFEEARAISRK